MKRIVRVVLALVVSLLPFSLISVQPAQAAPYVAQLYILAQGSGGTDGHAFIMVRNKTSDTITVGVRKVSGNGVITVGTWGNKPDGKGIYYNLERYFGSSAFASGVYDTHAITETQLATLTDVIKNNNSWSLTNNCSSFATKAWNSVSVVKYDAGLPNTPTNLKNDIINKSGKDTGLTIPAASPSDVYRQDGKTSSHQSSGSATGSSSSS